MALLAWVFTWWFGIRGNDDGVVANRVLTFQITSVDNGQPIADAQISFPGGSASTDANGSARLELPPNAVDIAISATGFESVYGAADVGVDTQQRIALRSVPPGATEDQPVIASTQVDGSAAPPAAPVATTAATATQPVYSGEVTTVAGVISDAGGQPIWDATILSGTNFARTAQDGSFQLDNVPVEGEVRVWAAGYADQWLPVAPEVNVAMQREDIKAAYLTGPRLNDEAAVQRIIDLAQTTEINAVVVVTKEWNVYYDTDVQFFIDADDVQPVFDPVTLVKRFKEAGLYTIARVVVFNDPVLAENRPDLAIETTDGGIWRGYNGEAWVNPYKQELWQPNIDLGIEAGQMGFDEVQFDYVRFPSDGDLSNAEFGIEHTYKEDERVATIASFLSMGRDQLTSHGIKTAADVFAIITVLPDDQGIGQRFADFTKVVDVISPMIYPSHFTGGPLGMTEEPNAEPYETLRISMTSAAEMVPGMVLKIRPWLQDFTMGEPPYGPKEVGDQIRATMEAGASGWMLWNPDSEFTVGALGPRE